MSYIKKLDANKQLVVQSINNLPNMVSQVESYIEVLKNIIVKLSANIPNYENSYIETRLDADLIGEFIGELADRSNEIENAYKPLYSAINDILDAIREPRKAMQERIKQVKDNLGKRIFAWEQQEKARIAEENRQKIEQAMAKAKEQAEEVARLAKEAEYAIKASVSPDVSDQEAIVLRNNAVDLQNASYILASEAIEPVITTETPKIAGGYSKVSWAFDVVDINAVPRNWLVLDDKAIQKFVNTRQDKAQIDGIRFYPKADDGKFVLAGKRKYKK